MPKRIVTSISLSPQEAIEFKSFAKSVLNSDSLTKYVKFLHATYKARKSRPSNQFDAARLEQYSLVRARLNTISQTFSIYLFTKESENKALLKNIIEQIERIENILTNDYKNP